MTNFVDSRGNLLESDAEGFVNTVNTVGVMGKGIALQFKNAYPANYRAYAKACKRHEVTLGRMFVFDYGQFTTPRWIVNFPTKEHWRSRSRIHDVETGLDDLRRVIIDLEVTSIAIPPLGCGNGGLGWNDVRPLIRAKLDGLPTEVLLYAPIGAPPASDMAITTPRPELTPGRAALIKIINSYSTRIPAVTQIAIQKLMYFLQEAGEPLNLNYQANRYGPYADNLRHVLKTVEGHYLQGYGDGSANVRDAEPIRVLPDAVHEASDVLVDEELLSRIADVLDLIEGHESPHELELLASVHWVVAHGELNDPEPVVEQLQQWSYRKQQIFTNEDIEAAWNHLRRKGWLSPKTHCHQEPLPLTY